ncbi:phage P2 family tail protein [Campylobacter iguaniorum]|uniref:phage tail protein n=1 Tax=Campylobacter iguaniorum TaxID=1244531 RepID=UPI00073A212F|nr:phage tail protein [Campylobacter iguaniorum]ALV24554.1 phage P2 family tail protein [Campylobacter iguaniorum]
MLNLKAYNDVLFRIDEVLSSKFDNILKFDDKFFYKQNDLNRSSLADMFDIEPKSRSLEQTKELLNAPLKTYFLEGTSYALDTALKAYFDKSGVCSWQDYSGEPYHFKILLDIKDKSVDLSSLNEIESIVEAYKNVRSVLDGITINLTSKATLRAGAYATLSDELTVYPYTPKDAKIEQTGHFGSSVNATEIISLNLSIGGGL